MNEMNTVNQDFIQIFKLFFDDEPIEIESKNTSHGESDFREVILYKCNSGKKYAIKLADNSFTFADKIEMWRRCAEEYRNYGYYCPSIIRSKSDNFPFVSYKGHNCIVYAEEYSVYRSITEIRLKHYTVGCQHLFFRQTLIRVISCLMVMENLWVCMILICVAKMCF